jgi:uncharacterized membrane protein
MADHLQNELKKEFQIERMILFSDAVFAIAITILALEIKVPSIDRHVATDQILLNSLDELIPKFIGFFVSFFIIGLYWTIHHRMFAFVINYNRRLLWLNLIFLMAIVLMPFSTGIYSEYIVRFLKVPVIIYVLNIIFLGIMNFSLWTYIANPKNELSTGIALQEKRYFAWRAVVVPSAFLIMGIIYILVNRKYAIYIPLIIPVILRIYKQFYFKKYQPKK